VQRDGDPERRLAVWRRPRGERGQRLPRSRERVRGCARRVVCGVGKIASRPSPMNFSISPPCLVMANATM
jgi:hypothetical protein